MNIKLLAKRMTLGFGTTVLAAAGLFGVQKANNDYIVTQAVNRTQYSDGNFAPRADNVAPVDLYMMATLDNPFTSAPGTRVETYKNPIGNYIKGLTDSGMYTPDMQELYEGHYASILVWSSWTGVAPPQSFVDAAEQSFQSVSSIGWQDNSYNVINQFSSVDKTKQLELFSPTTITDIYSNSAVTAPLDFAYKVVEINIDDVPAELGDMVFDYNNSANVNGSEYSVVLSNLEGGLNNLTSQSDLDEYIEEFGIFVRDLDEGNPFDVSTTPYPSLQTLNNQLNFVYDENTTTGTKTVSIWVETGSDTIEFGVNGATSSDAEGAFQFGFLGSSVSPDNVEVLTDPTESVPSTPTISGNPIVASSVDPTVHEVASDWSNATVDGSNIPEISNAEHVRFFMAPFTKWEAEVFYKGQGSDSFESQNNVLRLEHNGSAIEQSPSTFQIIAEDYQGGADPIYASYTDRTINGKRWMQVDIVMHKGEVQLNPNPGAAQDPFKLVNPQDQILFNIDDDYDTNWTNTGGFIELVQQTNQDERYKQILGDLYTNWSETPGYDSSAGTNDADRYKYVAPDLVRFPDDNGVVSEGFDWFPNSFDSYYIEDDGAIVANPTTSSDGNDLPIIDIENGKFEVDANGDIVHQLTTGYNIVDTLTTVTNLLANWSVSKLGADPDTVREHNFYRLLDASKSISFVQNNIINNSGVAGDTLAKTADALTRWWLGDLLTQEQNEIVAELVINYPTYDLSTTVEGIGGLLGSGDQAWQDSMQYIYHILQPLLAASMQELYVLEIKTFDNFKGAILGTHMSAYLNTSESTDIGINIDALKVVDNTGFDELIENLSLIALNGEKTIEVSNGAEALGSLVEFLEMFLIDGKYLTSETEQAQFKAFVDAGSFTDPTIYQDPNRQEDIRSMIGLLDSIIASGDFQSENTKTLSEIVNDIISLKNTNPLDDIRAAIQSVTYAIASNSQAVIHEFFGQEYGTTIMENLVIGRNLRVIITEYKDQLVARDLWDEMATSEKNAIEAGISGSYDPTTITQLGINTGYYNLSAFLKGLSMEDTVPTVAYEILSSDLLQSLTFEIPPSNAFVDLISDSSLIYRYSALFAGSILFIVASLTVGMTFRKSAKQHQTAQSLLVFRLTFLMIGLAGIIIGATGLLTGVI